MTEKDMEIQANARTISQLRRENIQLRAERDAAIADIYNMANSRSTVPCRYCGIDRDSRECIDCNDDYNNFEWRGIQYEEH